MTFEALPAATRTQVVVYAQSIWLGVPVPVSPGPGHLPAYVKNRIREKVISGYG